MNATATQPASKVGSTVHLLGTLITFKATALETEGSFSLVEVVTAPGQGTPPHLQRDDAEAFYVLDGTYEFMKDGKTFTGEAGTFVYIPRSVAHGFRNVGSASARMLIINLPGGLHENFFAEAGDPVTDAVTFPPMAPPDVPKLLEAAGRYGIEMLPA